MPGVVVEKPSLGESVTELCVCVCDSEHSCCGVGSKWRLQESNSICGCLILAGVAPYSLPLTLSALPSSARILSIL